MELSPDYEDLFKTFNAHKIRYLVVGAHAVTYYAEPRFTKDLDLWIPPELNDPRRVHKALKEFGAPLRGVNPGDFADKKVIFQIGIAPVRVDILTALPGVRAGKAWKNRKRSRYGKTPIAILGLSELIIAKRKSGRPQDRLDLAKLCQKKSKR